MPAIAVIIALAVLIFAAAILLLPRLVARRGHGSLEWIGAGLRFAAKALIALGLLVFCLSITSSLGYGLVAWLMVMTVWVRAAVHGRAVQKRSLFGALAMAVDKQMPLAPLAPAFSAERHGGFGNRARAAGRPAQHGRFPGRRDQDVSRNLAAGSGHGSPRGGGIGRFVRALEATSFAGRFDRTLLQTAMSRLFYILPAVLLFLTFMQIKIAPSYVKIFDDFDTSLPPITVAVVKSSASALVAVTCVFLIVAMFLTSIWAWCEWRGWIRPTLPGSKRIIKWVEMGVVLRVLALGARRQLSSAPDARSTG